MQCSDELNEQVYQLEKVFRVYNDTNHVMILRGGMNRKIRRFALD
jgi:hypothetical protein